MQLQIVNILQVLLIFQGVFFCFFLLSSPRAKYRSNRFLASFLGLLSFHMTLNLVFETSSLDFPDITPTLGLLYGPLLYLFVISLIRTDGLSTRLLAVHVSPWIVFLLLHFISLVEFQMVTGAAILFSMAGYIFGSFRAIVKYQSVLSDVHSETSSINLSWVIHLLYLLSSILILEAIRNFLFVPDSIGEKIAYSVMTLALLVFVVTLVYRGLKQPSLFGGISVEDISISKEKEERYASSTITDKEIMEHASNLEKLMKEKKPYINPSLKLSELAETMGVNPRHLSQTINTHFKMNFSEYVNQHRIADAKIQLAESVDSGKTILEILYETGFNTKSNFNHTFKELTGKTPSEFKKGAELG
ncbi:MAG: helix-turn-helix domain-containing protein [Ekhidna sp.]